MERGPAPPGPSLALRAFLAVGLTVTFYLFALGLAALLAVAGWFALTEARGGGAVRIALFCFVGAGVILWSVLPRIEKDVAPGPRLDPAQQPRLFAELRSIAGASGQEMPTDVYLVPDLNAGVYESGGFLGMGGRRRMVLGLPLLAVLRVSELRGVLAHEFGHYLGGETKLGPWIYQTRAAIGRAVRSLAEAGSWLRFLFLGYGKLFLRITLAISRRQELAADALAARVAGAAPLASGLRRTAGAAPFFQAYLGNELVPVLSSGFRPPIAEGFHRFLRSGEVANAVEGFVADVAMKDRGDPYDSHPPLPERLSALGNPPVPPPGREDDPLAATLLQDLPGLERALLASAFPGAPTDLAPVPWEETGPKVFVPLWRRQVVENRDLLRGLTPGSLPAALSKPPGDPRWRRRVEPEPGEGPPKRALVAAAAVAVLLFDRGWTLRCVPGDEVTLTRDGAGFAPFRETPGFPGALSAEEWTERWRRAGLAEVPLESAAGAS